MADIFISYSRKDAEVALQFAERLRTHGMSVWIDQHGIEASASWSGEIVRAINHCSMLIVLLSPSSVESDNVTREVVLACEKKKRILPIELQAVTLSESLEYPLAGIQRVAHTNWEAIERVLAKVVTSDEVTIPLSSSHTPSSRHDPLGRRKLAVLPFENLSSDPDNEWFADGLTQELIGLLSKLSSLAVTDRRTVMVYKNSTKPTKTIAQEVNVEFIIEGTVRRSGEQLRITCELVEVWSDKHIWSETFKGTVEDIFSIQESVAKNIVDNLDIALHPKEQASLRRHLTGNATAYEFFLRARELGYTSNEEKGIELFEQAIALEPQFTEAYAGISSVYNRIFWRTGNFPGKAYDYALKAYTLDPTNAAANAAMGGALFNSGQPEKAFPYLLHAYQYDPQNPSANSWLGYYYEKIENYIEAAKYYQQALDLVPGEAHYIFHLWKILEAMDDEEGLTALANKWLPYMERRVRARHDHESADFMYIQFLQHLNRGEEVIPAIEKLDPNTFTDAMITYNYACMTCRISAPYGLKMLRRALELGFPYIEGIRDDQSIAPLHGRLEFDALLKEFDEKILKEKHG